jgi:hypothetical protein
LLTASCSSAKPPKGDDSLPVGCTLVGCVDGANIRLTALEEPLVAGAYRIELALDSEHRVCRFDLPQDIPIRNGEVLFDEQHSLEYTVEHPNGVDCPPECKRAELDLEFDRSHVAVDLPDGGSP